MRNREENLRRAEAAFKPTQTLDASRDYRAEQEAVRKRMTTQRSDRLNASRTVKIKKRSV